MTQEEIADKMLRSVARSMEVEGADYERVLKRMRTRLKKLKKQSKKD